MARIYSRKKGRSGSHRPPVKVVPRWVEHKKKEVEELIVKLAKEKHTSAAIGTILRDQYGIPDVKALVDKSIAEIMKEHKIYPEFPEDLMNLFKKSVKVREHLKRSKKDKHAKAGLINLESKIRRLINYYSREGKVPKDFAYDIEKVKLIIQK